MGAHYGSDTVKEPRPKSLFPFLKPQLPRSDRGFSLYDMLTTLVVVSTIAAVAVPSFQQLLYRQRIAGAINTLISALYLARSEAIKRGETAVLCPSPDGRSCVQRGHIWEEGYLLYIDSNNNARVDAEEIVVRYFETTTGLQVQTSANRDDIRYLPNGLASGTNATFKFCDAHNRGAPRTVIVSNSGRARTSTRMPDGGAIPCPI